MDPFCIQGKVAFAALRGLFRIALPCPEARMLRRFGGRVFVDGRDLYT
jgi:hypothetical protein